MATAVAASPTLIQPKFVALTDALSTEMVERADVIDTSVLALIAKMHHFQLSEPGTGKSRLVRKIRSHIGGLAPFDYFETLMTKFSNPEEVFGPLSLILLQQDRYVYKTDGYFPVAKFAFLDEIWKANAAILNAFLMALNERQFRNDGQMGDIPLWSMFCASNELPEGEELNALNDRIQFRHIVKRIQEQAAFIEMLKLHLAPAIGHVITWDEIETAHAESQQVVVPNDVLAALNKVRTDLRADGVEPSDRRFVDSLSIIQAAAWLDGQTTADIEHMRPLAHVLWTTPDEAPKVARLLIELANPLDREALNLLEVVEQLGVDLDKMLSEKDPDPTMKNRKGVELHNKVDRAKVDLTKLVQQVQDSGRKSAKVEEVRKRLLGVTQRLLKELFAIDGDDLVL